MQQGRCPYYRYQAEADPQDAARPIAIYEYCNHRHSPAPATVVLFTPEGGNLLKCGGDLKKCQVPPHLRLGL